MHGYLDYVTVIVFLTAPALFGLAGFPAILAYLLAGVHFIMTLVTDFPLGVGRLLPFFAHGWVERLVGPALVLVSFVPAFSVDASARMFYVVIGIIITVVGLLTDYRGSQ